MFSDAIHLKFYPAISCLKYITGISVKHFERILCFVDRASLYNLVNLHSTLHTRQSSTKSDKYQVLHRYSYFCWWQAHSRPKHVEKRNKRNKKNWATIWLYLQGCEWIILDFKPSSCSEHRILSFGWFPGIWTLRRHTTFWCRGIASPKKNVTLRVNLFSTFPWLDHPIVNIWWTAHTHTCSSSFCNFFSSLLFHPS